jgi:hypothetical protein
MCTLQIEKDTAILLDAKATGNLILSSMGTRQKGGYLP